MSNYNHSQQGSQQGSASDKQLSKTPQTLAKMSNTELSQKINSKTLDLPTGLEILNVLDNRITQLNRSIYFLRQQKNALSDKMVTYLKAKKMHRKNLVLNGNKYKYSKSTPSVNVTKNYVYERLVTYFKGNEDKAEELLDYIYNDRERTVREDISITRK